MRLPRKGILIRLCIYIPLLGFFGWKAWQRYQAEQTVERAAPEIDGVKRTLTTPDGKSIEFIEITEDQARKMGYQPDTPAKAPDAPAPAEPAVDGKTPPPAAPGAN